MLAISAAIATANGSLPELVSKSQEENGDSKAVPETPAAISDGELRNSDAALPAVADSPVSILSILKYFDINKLDLYSNETFEYIFLVTDNCFTKGSFGWCGEEI